MNCIFLRRGYGTSGDGVNYVEYIESSGSQYIDTGFKPNGNTRVVVDVSVLSSQTSEGHFASCVGGGSYYTLYFSSGKLCGTRYGTQSLKTLSAMTAGERYVIDKNKNVTTIGADSYTHNYETFQMSYSLSLFGRNNAGTTDRFVSCRLYSCQIYDNGTLVRDFRPALDPDGVACLYDKVNREYVYNAGTGTFTAGGSIIGGDSSTISTVITGTGDATYCYATYNGTKYTSAATLQVQAGDTIAFTTKGSSYAYGRVTINGTQMHNTASSATYNWTVPSGVNAISIELAYTTDGSIVHQGIITVTTS